MKDQIILSLPYPVRLFGINFSKKRNIGFLFTNLSMFIFRENLGFKTSEDYEKWVKENGQARLINEMIYASAISFCMDKKVKQNFTKHGLSVALTLCSEDLQMQLMDKWTKSQTFGVKIDEKKKKIKKL